MRPVRLLVELDLAAVLEMLEVFRLQERSAVEEALSIRAGNADTSPFCAKHVTQTRNHTAGQQPEPATGSVG